MAKTIKVKIYRYNPEKDEKPYYKTYTVPYKKGMFVLDALNYIQKNLDGTLAFRWECRSGICGTCGLKINGKPVLSCTTQLDPKSKVNLIEPMDNFTVEKDLIVDLTLVLEKYKRIRPYLEQVEEKTVTEKAANASKKFRKCIECGCCISAAKSLEKNQHAILDPMAIVKLARFLTDPRDSLDRKKIAKKEGINAYTKKEAKELADSCPRYIPIDEAIDLLKKK